MQCLVEDQKRPGKATIKNQTSKGSLAIRLMVFSHQFLEEKLESVEFLSFKINIVVKGNFLVISLGNCQILLR